MGTVTCSPPSAVERGGETVGSQIRSPPTAVRGRDGPPLRSAALPRAPCRKSHRLPSKWARASVCVPRPPGRARRTPPDYTTELCADLQQHCVVYMYM